MLTTVRRWRNRDQVSDNHTTPKVIHKALRQEQAALINALRDITGAPLDELLLLVNDGLGIAVSRATLNRYLKLRRYASIKPGVTPAADGFTRPEQVLLATVVHMQRQRLMMQE